MNNDKDNIKLNKNIWKILFSRLDTHHRQTSHFEKYTALVASLDACVDSVSGPDHQKKPTIGKNAS